MNALIPLRVHSSLMSTIILRLEYVMDQSFGHFTGLLLPARRQVKPRCHEFISRELAFVVIKVAEPGPAHFFIEIIVF